MGLHVGFHRVYNISMSLSEFISINQENPDPKIEWDQSKLLIKTIVDSGAVQLLERLRDSILSNPTLKGSGMFDRATLRRLLFVYNQTKLANFLKSEGNQLEKSFNLSVPSDHYPISKLPWARIEFDYNPKRKQYSLGGGYFNSPISYESYTAFDKLVVECSVPGRLALRLVSNSSMVSGSEGSVVMEENQWRQHGAVDNALGQLYAKSPAQKIIK